MTFEITIAIQLGARKKKFYYNPGSKPMSVEKQSQKELLYNKRCECITNRLIEIYYERVR